MSARTRLRREGGQIGRGTLRTRILLEGISRRGRFITIIDPTRSSLRDHSDPGATPVPANPRSNPPNPSTGAQMLTFTDRAHEMVRTYMEESEGELTALRISSGDATPGSPSWELALVADDEWDATDVEFQTGELTVLVERDVADLLQGATVDYVERGGQVGFQVDTRPGAADGAADGPAGSVPAATATVPGAAESGGRSSGEDLPAGSPAAQGRNDPSPFGGTSAPQAPPPTEAERIEIEDPPEGPMADRIRELLDERINPAVAMHGGHIGLAEVKEGEIFIVMSGGCQGCALSRMTLKQGVERMIRQEIPEVSAVHDVTDHAQGDNPYYDAPIS